MAYSDATKSISPTLIQIGVGASIFIAVKPIANQIGLLFKIKGTGGTLEISGGGVSLAASGSVLGYAPTLVANGSGYPIAGGDVMSITGNPTIWLSSGGVTTTIAVAYLKNSEDGS